MFPENHKIDGNLKLQMLTSTFALALLVIFILNLFFLLKVISENIYHPDFIIAKLTIKKNYLMLNNQEFGLTVISNIILFVFIWFCMLIHTLKSMNKKIVTFFL